MYFCKAHLKHNLFVSCSIAAFLNVHYKKIVRNNNAQIFASCVMWDPVAGVQAPAMHPEPH